MMRIRRITAVCSLLAALVPAAGAEARIEIYLMAQTVGLKPPPLPGDILFRGTPFGHMALYIESAARDGEKIIRQCEEGERGGLVLTVDKQLKDAFFIAYPREEFFYGDLNPAAMPPNLTRDDVAVALARFEERFGHLYRKGPGISGLGQDYGVLYIRSVWGLVYPTTREEEAKIIEYWQEHRHDEFVPMTNNCVTTIVASLKHAGLDDRRFFIRGLAPYNAWLYCVKKFALESPDARAPNGNYLRRDGTCVAEYQQLVSDAVYRSGRPFNVYTLKNLGYLLWASPRCSTHLPSDEPVSYRSYPTGMEHAAERLPRGIIEMKLMRYPSRGWEFVRLWYQSFYGLWFLATH